MEYVELKDVEPEVVDLTVHDDYPDISVRMPLAKMKATHQTDYLEMRYIVDQGRVGAVLNLSPALLHRLVSSQAAIDQSPMMDPGRHIHGAQLGPIENLHIAVTKLKDFHDRGEWKRFFTRFLPQA